MPPSSTLDLTRWAVWVLCLDWGMYMWWVRLFHPGAQFFSSLTNLINVYLFMYWKHSHSLEVFLFRWSDCISWKAWERFCPHPDGQMDGLSLILNLLLHKKYWKCDETLSPLMRHTLCTNTFNQYIKRNSGEQRKQAVYTQHWHAWSWYDMVFTQMLSKNTETQGTVQPEKTGYTDQQEGEGEVCKYTEN